MDALIGMDGLAKTTTRRVELYNASASAVTFRKGTAVCYDRDYATTETGQTAADPWGGRDFRVLPPDETNNMWFAGVLAERVTIPALSSKSVEIFEPGSICEIALAAFGAGGTAFTIDSTMVTFGCTGTAATRGLFGRAGLPGRGSAIALETLAGGLAAGASAAPVAAAYAAAFTVTNKQIAISGIEAYAAVDDTVLVLSGAEDDGGAGIAPYVTAIKEVGTNYIILDTDPETEDAHVSLYIYRGEPLVQVYLMDGPQSGGTQFSCPYSAAGRTQAIMVGGTTFIGSGITPSAEPAYTLANPIRGVDRKVFIEDGAMGTHDWTVTVTSGTTAAGAALSSFDLDADGDGAHLLWMGNKWVLVGGLVNAVS